ncbi:MAG: DUF3098 domain-containing protein [Prevotellaceae bacterium]|jgi:hypothetical protein|nr:DUF3098 domain-containing protein [Prevotellaceae bacterium]
MAKQQLNVQAKASAGKGQGTFALGTYNYKLMLVGFAIIVVGFVLMSGGKSPNPGEFNGAEIYSFRRITLAPLVVVLGFVFEIYAIMKRPKPAQA